MTQSRLEPFWPDALKPHQTPQDGRQVASTPEGIELEGRIYGLAVELQDYIDDWDEGKLRRMAEWLWENPNDPRTAERVRAYREAYGARYDSWPKLGEYLELMAAWQLWDAYGPPRCPYCELGETWTYTQIKEFLRQHGKAARLCARHAVRLLAARRRAA